MEDLNASPFLRLPAEIRQEIYRHALPYSAHKAGAAILTWHPNGGTSILRANWFVYNEAVKILYTENTFQIWIGPRGECHETSAQIHYASTCLSLGQYSVSLRHHPIPDRFKAIRHFYLHIPKKTEDQHLPGSFWLGYPSDTLFMIDILREGLPIAVKFLNQVKQISTLMVSARILRMYSKPFGLSILLEAFGALAGVGKATLHSISEDHIPEAIFKELKRHLEAPRSTAVGTKRSQEAEPAKVLARMGSVPKRRR
ncbi:MAG: hypothetical protein Q9187_007889 [Circinaria calcarea]